MSVKLYATIDFFDRPASRYLLRENGWEIHFPVRAEDGFLPSPKMLGPALMDSAPEIEFIIAAGIRLNRDFFDRALRLRWVGVFGVGFNHIDLEAATDHGVLVTNTPGANARATAEMALGLMLALARNIVPAHNHLMRGEWAHIMGNELWSKTLGIIGLGHIGTALAESARGLGMRVLSHTRTPKPELAVRLGLRETSLEDLLWESDYVSLHIPAVAGAKPFLDRARIAMMKPGSRLINVSRGQLVDYDALTEALAQGRLAGAGLDVYPHEPLSMERMQEMSHPLFTLSNVVCTPHSGGVTEEAVDRICAVNLRDLELVLKKERSPRALNPQVYEQGRVFEKDRS